MAGAGGLCDDRTGMQESPHKPADWVYVHNFDEADRPIAVDLESGTGVRLRKDMRTLVEELREELPKAFRQEDFSRQRQRLGREYEQRGQEVFQALEKKAKEKGLTVQQLPNGQVGMVPMKDDRPMTREEFEELPDEQKEEINARRQDLAEHMDSVMTQAQDLKRRLGTDVREVEREFASRIVNPRLDEIKARYPHDKLQEWIEKMREHMVDNIERESKLSGQTYDKAMLILDGYLRNTYAREHPLALSAGIAMEQSYGMIEGDSASVAELVCLLSAIAEMPLRQDIAVTGSVNQWGQVQAVGGVNEKVEGFFDVCREAGLTGDQGVCIPRANVRNLILRPDVIDAVREGRFHIWPLDRVEDALQLLGGIPAGSPGEEASFHGKVDRRLRDMAKALKEQQLVPGEKSSVSIQSQPARRDPRPPLPGRE